VGRRRLTPLRSVSGGFGNFNLPDAISFLGLPTAFRANQPACHYRVTVSKVDNGSTAKCYQTKQALDMTFDPSLLFRLVRAICNNLRTKAFYVVNLPR
jgi:hypothetical protein